MKAVVGWDGGDGGSGDDNGLDDANIGGCGDSWCARRQISLGYSTYQFSWGKYPYLGLFEAINMISVNAEFRRGAKSHIS